MRRRLLPLARLEQRLSDVVEHPLDERHLGAEMKHFDVARPLSIADARAGTRLGAKVAAAGRDIQSDRAGARANQTQRDRSERLEARLTFGLVHD